MATVRFHLETDLRPAEVLETLTDFSERRPSLWRNLDPRFYQVHDRGPSWAEVTEGSAFAGGVWERSRYDWSHPGFLRIEVLESNTFEPGSSWEYRIEPYRGGSWISFRLHRTGRTLKGSALSLLMRLFGRRVFESDLSATLDQVRLAEAA